MNLRNTRWGSILNFSKEKDFMKTMRFVAGVFLSLASLSVSANGEDAKRCAMRTITDKGKEAMANICSATINVRWTDQGSCHHGCALSIQGNSKAVLGSKPEGFMEIAACFKPYYVRMKRDGTYECQ